MDFGTFESRTRPGSWPMISMGTAFGSVRVSSGSADVTAATQTASASAKAQRNVRKLVLIQRHILYPSFRVKSPGKYFSSQLFLRSEFPGRKKAIKIFSN